MSTDMHRTSRIDRSYMLMPFVFLLCGVLIACLGISDTGPGHTAAALATIVWVLIGLFFQIKGSLALLLLVALNVQGFSPVHTSLCLSLTIFCALYHILCYPNNTSAGALRALQNELRDAEFQQTILQRHINRYPHLLNACTVFSHAQELGQLAHILSDEAIKLIPSYLHVSIYFGKDSDIYCPHGLNKDRSHCANPIDENIRYVIQESRLLVLHQDTLIHLYIPLRGERQQELLSEDHKLNGVLYITFQSKGVDDELRTDILNAFARLGGLSLASVNLMEQARALALYDDLTGLFGKHEFERRLHEHASLCRRKNMILGIIMCDMDHLKLFNDEFGHHAGDVALKNIAQTMKQTIEKSATPEAIACRFGGEEFSIFLVCHHADDVKMLSQAMCNAIAQTPLQITKTIQNEDVHGHIDKHITASFGWSILQEDEKIADCIQRADVACYHAKELGRNQVCEALP